MALLQAESITVCVDNRPLLSDVSLEVEAGELVCVIGPNGAGKSTLLTALCGETAMDNGWVNFKGTPLHNLSARNRARQVAVLPQNNPLTFAFTGLELVSLSRTPHSTGNERDRQICQEAMAMLDVNHLSERLYPTLSGGEQQRLQLARVMAQIWRAEDGGDRLLLLDEPATSLDIAHQYGMMRAVRDFARSGVAVVMTVHDLAHASGYSDRILALKQGHSMAYGSAESVLTAENIQQLYGYSVTVIPHPLTGRSLVVADV
ncbi:heme ABC transporter ATP-binding protein [Microbulbifer sp. OS29]|uniref:Heme ABC transporter ATP-binding protein n=1 Tax=Microbulbifer okhotskensis TaxID=2926617 RepID=A0A9X2EPP3_9GAMM|nr:heme ABC transporter ATP-binding protein [Microbulbifer okhotskensis]MCO1336154.1 heme ABC transporter ATP-binding protein [Microbulbifer okhotskensis]